MTLDRMRICRGCGCTNDHACPGGCSWVLIDFEIHPGRERLQVQPIESGVCSSCAEVVEWDPNSLASMLSGDALQTQAELGLLSLRW